MDKLEHVQSVQSTFLNLDSKKQERILNAAVDEFAGHGFEGASINTLVRTVGISKGSIF
jgi:AcrR family transcriptional regulator